MGSHCGDALNTSLFIIATRPSLTSCSFSSIPSRYRKESMDYFTGRVHSFRTALYASSLITLYFSFRKWITSSKRKHVWRRQTPKPSRRGSWSWSRNNRNVLEGKSSDTTPDSRSNGISPETSSIQRPGHELQLSFNHSIIWIVDDLKDDVLYYGVRDARKQCDEIKKQLDNRNKWIKIADCCDWATVKEYEADDLADDSGDERKIRAAESGALTKSRVRDGSATRY